VAKPASQAAGGKKHCHEDCDNEDCVPPSAKAKHQQTLSGIPKLPDGHKVMACRRPLLKQITAILYGKMNERLRIALVSGPPGIGKSWTIAEWWLAEERRNVRRSNVLSLKCGTMPGDQIIRTINRHFLGEEAENLSTELARAICAATPLIVLDGLSNQSPDEVAPEGPTNADWLTLRKVGQFLSFLGTHNVRARVLLGIQDAGANMRIRDLETSFHANVAFKRIILEPLSPKDGAELLRALGIQGMSQSDLERISGKLQGLPIAMNAAARYLMTTSRHEDREKFVTSCGYFERNSFTEMFGKYISALDSTSTGASLHAFMRLLALMPGPTLQTEIDELLAIGGIKRLEGATVADFIMQQLPPFIVVLGAHLDLHPFVRSFLRKHISDVINGQHTDPHISREEIYRIHAIAAKRCLERLKWTPNNGFEKPDVLDIEGAIYHLITLRGLCDQDELTNNRETALLSYDEFMTRIQERRITPNSITSFLITNVAERFLFSNNHHMTRILGQFETKARILTYFFENQDLKGDLRFIAPDDARRLLSEIGICWMHSGRVHSATAALVRAKNLIVLGAAMDANQLWLAQPSDIQDWANRAEIMSTEALLALRQGRDISTIESRIAPVLNTAEQLCDLILNMPPTSDITDTQKKLIRSTRRVISRKAQICLISGDMPKAVYNFNHATNLGKRLKQDYLDGEAARRFSSYYCHEGDYSEALRIVDWNIKKSSATGKGIAPESNEIIPFLTTKAMILRLMGDLDQAAAILEDVNQHQFVRRGECTFTAARELELEKLRLRVARGDKTGAIERLQDLRIEMECSHHNELAIEIRLILAELLPRPKAEEVLTQAETQAWSWQWKSVSNRVQEIFNAWGREGSPMDKPRELKREHGPKRDQSVAAPGRL